MITYDQLSVGMLVVGAILLLARAEFPRRVNRGRRAL